MGQARIGLLGGYSGDWRTTCANALARCGIDCYDPTDKAWDTINFRNGDEKQPLIDSLVGAQHQNIRNLDGVIFHMDAWEGTDNQGRTIPAKAYAARCELGFLAGHGIQTWVHIHPQVEGRNYLWALIRCYPHLHRCNSLADALNAAVEFASEPE